MRKVALVHVNFFSEVLGMSSQMEVILPQETDRQIGTGHAVAQEKCPVLYLLHGMTDNHTAWCRNTSVERYAAERGIAVVMPDGHLGWYTDMNYGFRYFTFLSEELPELCGRFFPCISGKREDRFAAGNSMGGYGAMKLALRCPELFAGAASLSGGLDAWECAKGFGTSFYPSLAEDIFGSRERFEENGDDLFQVSERLMASKGPVPSLYQWCGTEDFLFEQNHRMRDHLQKLGYPLTYRESSGDHSWKYWDVRIQEVLDWIGAVRAQKGARENGVYAG